MTYGRRCVAGQACHIGIGASRSVLFNGVQLMRGVMLAGLVLLLGLQCPAIAQIPFTTIQKGYYSGITQPLQIVIRDQNEWVALWKKHSFIRPDPPRPPPVDFSAGNAVELQPSASDRLGFDKPR